MDQRRVLSTELPFDAQTPLFLQLSSRISDHPPVIERGYLVAVDIASEMLNVAKKACEERGLKNVKLLLAGAQKLDLELEENSFDVLFCSSALVLFPDEKWTLTYWNKF